MEKAQLIKELIKINQKEAKKKEEERQINYLGWCKLSKGQEMRDLLGCVNQDLTESEWKVMN